MKKLLIGLLLLTTSLLVSCIDDDYASEKVLTLTIASTKSVEMRETPSWTGEVQLIPLFIYKQGSSEWQLWRKSYSIDGFSDSYEPGYEYQIKVYERKLVNPPADASDVVYHLKKIVSKVKKTSKGIPSEFTTKAE